MARPLRIAYPGAWYHVLNRGAGRKPIFVTDKQRKLFLEILQATQERYKIEIHAYCLMGNHYHLLLHTPLGNLSRAMRHLNSVYTQKFNRLRKSDGALFRGRYKAILVDAENYLLQLSRYIHLNPVTAKLTRYAQDYPWSSYAAYLTPKLRPDWLCCQEIAGRFKHLKQLRDFTEEGVDAKTAAFYQRKQRAPILGDEAFTKELAKKSGLNKRKEKEIPEKKYLQQLQLPTLAAIMQTVATYYNVSLASLKMTKPRYGNWPRAVAIYLAVQLSQLTHEQIASIFSNISYSGVSQLVRRLQKQLENTPSLQQEIASIQQQII